MSKLQIKNIYLPEFKGKVNDVVLILKLISLIIKLYIDIDCYIYYIMNVILCNFELLLHLIFHNMVKLHTNKAKNVQSILALTRRHVSGKLS